MSLMTKSLNPIEAKPIKKQTDTFQIGNQSVLAPEQIYKSIKGSLKEYNDDQTNDEDGPVAKQNKDKVEHIEVGSFSDESQMSVLRFRSFILKIDGLDNTNYTAIERILTMDTNSEESILQAAQEYCQDTG